MTLMLFGRMAFHLSLICISFNYDLTFLKLNYIVHEGAKLTTMIAQLYIINIHMNHF